ncbi:PIN domain nuclease [Glycomyces arizonensis]|uniref:PIN domain nuclease n=1 Tax=Glycomyces arizonensis TaxID=256035 RepID=UPI0004035125|nr:PIN domain nuclease [Glycomyces arizonensis]
MSAEIYLLDTSAWVHRILNETVRRRVDELWLAGRVATCHMVVAEVLNNAQDKRSYKSLQRSLIAARWLPVTEASMDRALEVHTALAEKAQHRHFSLPDLFIAATAELAGATMLHYDSDYDRIAAVTGQPTEWVAPRGSL